MMNEESSFDELLQCSICLERFTQPKGLPCQHTFCLNCLRGIGTKGDKTLICPQCRKIHPVPDIGVQGFPDNLMAKNLLAMVGEFTDCHDCSKKFILQTCEHCKLQVCGNCRAAHNRLQGEISLLLKILNEKIIKRIPGDDVEVSARIHAALNNTNQEAGKVVEVFDKAVAVLYQRKEEIIRELQNTAILQEALMNGKTDLMGQYRNQMRGCQTSESLEQLRDSITAMEVEQVLSTVESGVRFEYDLSDVAKFGRVACGDGSYTSEPSAAATCLAPELPAAVNTTTATNRGGEMAMARTPATSSGFREGRFEEPLLPPHLLNILERSRREMERKVKEKSAKREK